MKSIFCILLTLALIGETTATFSKKNFTIFHFVCKDTVVQCGKQVTLPPQTACNIRKAVIVRNVTTGTLGVCGRMINEARKTHGKTNWLFKNNTFCPNKALVTSYAMYEADGGKGRYCGAKKCVCCKGADGFGDPHFVTYDGTPYSYHGKCDLVLAHSEEFGDGLGLRVHARTELVDSWSRISNAAVQIGSDVIELTNTARLYYNGVDVTDSPDFSASMANTFSVKKVDNTMNGIPKLDVMISVNEDKRKIKLSLFKKVIAVHVGTTVSDINGMLGNREIEGFVGRNEEILSDANQMGQNWQVTAAEPMLFREIRAPQFPETCQLPAVDSRRRLSSIPQQYHRRASEVCADVTDPDMKNFCVEDVLMTGDVDIARTYAEAF